MRIGGLLVMNLGCEANLSDVLLSVKNADDTYRFRFHQEIKPDYFESSNWPGA
jgi:hypothetical protein